MFLYFEQNRMAKHKKMSSLGPHSQGISVCSKNRYLPKDKEQITIVDLQM